MSTGCSVSPSPLLLFRTEATGMAWERRPLGTGAESTMTAPEPMVESPEKSGCGKLGGEQAGAPAGRSVLDLLRRSRARKAEGFDAQLVGEETGAVVCCPTESDTESFSDGESERWPLSVKVAAEVAAVVEG